MKALIAILALLSAAAAPAQTRKASLLTPQVSDGRVVLWPLLDGGGVGPMSVWVWLPPSYGRERTRRYPVLYMNDGQNVFDRRLSGFDQEWQVDEAIARMARQADLREWIVVGVESPRSRYHSLFPNKLFRFLPAGFQSRVMKLNSGDPPGPLAGDAYLRFVTKVVKRRVDRSLRTLAGPRDTAVMGSSMGGLMAFYAMAEYPQIFGQAAALSMHVALASSSENGLDHAQIAKQAAAAFGQYLRGSRMRPGPNRLYIDMERERSTAATDPIPVR